MNSLLSLHQSILEPIFSDWLQVQHLCCLDTAVCNNEMRNYLLTILSLSRATVDEESDYAYDCGYYEWLYSRRLPVNRLVLSEIDCSLHSEELKFILSSKHLSELEAPACEEVVSLITGYSLCIKKLIVYSCDSESLLISVLKLVGANVIDLDIETCSSFSDISCEIVKYCPMLKKYECESLLTIDRIALLGSCPIETMNHVPLVHLMKTAGFNNSTVSLEACNDQTDTALKIGSGCYHFTELHIEGDDVEADYLKPHLSTVRDLVYYGEWSVLAKLLPHCKQITSLMVYALSVDDKNLTEMISKFSLLRELTLGWTVSDNAVLYVVKHCPLLEFLRINRVVLAYETLQHMTASLPKLRFLCLHQTMPEGLMMQHAVGLEAVEVIHELTTEQSSFRMHRSGNSSFTSSLCFVNQDSVSCGWCTRLFKQNPGLTYVEFTNQGKLNNDVIAALTKYCPMLTEFSAAYCDKITDAGLYTLTSTCKQLTVLRIRTLKKRTKLSLDRLLQGLVLLKNLCIFGRSDLHSGELHWIAQHCPGITDVNLSFCTDVRDDDVIALLTGCQRLSYLSLQGCWRITAAVLPAVTHRRPKMKSLNVRGASITDVEVRDIMDTTADADSYLVTDFDDGEEMGDEEEVMQMLGW